MVFRHSQFETFVWFSKIKTFQFFKHLKGFKNRNFCMFLKKSVKRKTFVRFSIFKFEKVVKIYNLQMSSKNTKKCVIIHHEPKLSIQ